MATCHSRTLSAALATVVGAGLLLVPVQSASADMPPFQGPRMAAQQGTKLWIKEGSIYEPWVEQGDDIRSFRLLGDRIGVLRTNGQLDVKAGDLGPGWHTVNTDSVTDFQLSGDRIAYTEGTDLYITEGDFGSPPVHQVGAPVKKFQLSGDRVAVLTPNGTLKVKEGDLGPGWADVATGVRDFELYGDEIVFNRSGNLWTLTELYGKPQEIIFAQGVTKFDVEGDRLAWLDRNGSLKAVHRTVNTVYAPVTISESVTDFQLSAKRIGYVENGDLWAQDGPLEAPSTVQETDIDGFEVDGYRLAVIKDGALLVKEGDLGPGWYVALPDKATAVEFQGPVLLED
ncbi:hypothetical protein GCM10022243_56740 [Saccharothrix violaceirubra]|uniref:Uncharacterized protein n=1 Tax=Saccharothrix violaceirubra TaxID=413306 RepID=A0A7W7T3H9_9PSEU|nr:hypothetical protein [Saccharothrix violaceirubra]MBB4965894.1 hypothetical protein [Saccharothrix violaceirubra]